MEYGDGEYGGGEYGDGEDGDGEEGEDGGDDNYGAAPSDLARSALAAFSDAAARAMGGGGGGGIDEGLLDRILGFEPVSVNVAAARAPESEEASGDAEGAAAPEKERVTYARSKALPSSGFGAAVGAARRR